MNIKLEILKPEFTICKVTDYSQVDFTQAFCFMGKTDQEHSLVCMSDCVPKNIIEKEDGWRAFRIQGSLDFSLIGIVAKLSNVLAQNQIGIFVVSTYNTDYVLTKSDAFDRAIQVLQNEGYGLE